MKNNDPALEQGEMSDEEIDVNLDGTFPASDPPSWTLGTDHRKELSDQEKDAQSKASTSERKARK